MRSTQFTTGSPDIHTDILIVGGGTGGCAAAMSATSMGMHVIMTEPTDWIGGQLTSQTVPPDEHLAARDGSVHTATASGSTIGTTTL